MGYYNNHNRKKFKKTITVDRLYQMVGDKTFEMFIDDRKRIKLKDGSYTAKLSITVLGQKFELWEPKNKIWVRFSPQVGMGLICNIVKNDNYQYIQPKEQLLVVNDTRDVLDLYDLPFKDEQDVRLGLGIVSNSNKTQYCMLLDGNNRYLIRRPEKWKLDIEDMQYRYIDVSYKRTDRKGFLTLNRIGERLDQLSIDRLFK